MPAEFPVFTALASLEFLAGEGKWLLRAVAGVLLLLFFVYLLVIWWNATRSRHRSRQTGKATVPPAAPAAAVAAPCAPSPPAQKTAVIQQVPITDSRELLLRPETRRAAVAAAIILAPPPSLSRNRR